MGCSAQRNVPWRGRLIRCSEFEVDDSPAPHMVTAHSTAAGSMTVVGTWRSLPFGDCIPTVSPRRRDRATTAYTYSPSGASAAPHGHSCVRTMSGVCPIGRGHCPRLSSPTLGNGQRPDHGQGQGRLPTIAGKVDLILIDWTSRRCKHCDDAVPDRSFGRANQTLPDSIVAHPF